MPEKKLTVNNRVARTLIAIALITAASLMTGCSNAKGLIRSTNAEGDVFMIDGPDYGIKVTAVIKNVGESGPIKIRATLSCSEGEWERTRNLQFNAGEEKTVILSFPEPTINASNIFYGVSVFPSADQK